MKCRGLQKTQLVSELMLEPTQLSVQKLEEEGQSAGHGAVGVHPQWSRRMTHQSRIKAACSGTASAEHSSKELRESCRNLYGV